ncbi:unnamed protein product, partial [Sphacelaria rigidula]
PASILGLSWQLIRVHLRTQVELKVASEQVGVASNCLANMDPIQSRMAQIAKPGEGDELPGSEVTKCMAQNKHAAPGVGLISPAPHHDIFSIEDSVRLIPDLTDANITGEVSVKPVSGVGVCVMTDGVAKAKADHMKVSGRDDGTGAAAWCRTLWKRREATPIIKRRRFWAIINTRTWRWTMLRNRQEQAWRRRAPGRAVASAVR